MPCAGPPLFIYKRTERPNKYSPLSLPRNAEKGALMSTADIIRDNPDKSRYDQHAKQILKDKNVLAFIMMNCIAEFEGYTKEEAIAAIDGDIEVASRSVAPTSNDRQTSIPGDDTECIIPGEGKTTFDVLFHALTKEGKNTRIYVNLEAQNSFYPGYDLVTRGIVYSTRMISQQMGNDFTDKNYDKINKVYSIWICMNPPKENREHELVANTILKYNIQPSIIYPVGGNKNVRLGRYDLLTVMFINLGKGTEGSDNDNIAMFSTLFSNTMSADERIERMKTDFDVDLDLTTQEEVAKMCNISEGIGAELKIQLEEKEAQLEANKAELEANKAELEANKAELEKKDAEIARLKAALEQARK